MSKVLAMIALKMVQDAMEAALMKMCIPNINTVNVRTPDFQMTGHLSVDVCLFEYQIFKYINHNISANFMIFPITYILISRSI